MKSFTRKKAELGRLKDKLDKAKITVFTTFSRSGEKGLNVTAMSQLKKQLRTVEAEYVVEKKTLLDKALPIGKFDVFGLNGSAAIAFGYGDEAAIAKTLYLFSRKNPALKLFGAMWGEQVMDEKDFLEFAKLPSREVLISQIMGLMQYPLSALASTLQQIADKK